MSIEQGSRIFNSTKEDSVFSNSPIEKLDENSLICIFKHLSIADLVKVERVCKSWQVIAKQSWSKVKKLSMNPKELGLKPLGTMHRYKEINKDVVESILKRCGKYLLEIDILIRNIDGLLLVAKYCKNIQTIDCRNSSVRGINEISENCKNISKMRICGIDENEEFEDALGNLILKNRKLRVFELGSYDKIRGDFLLKLPLDQMENIAVPPIKNSENFINLIKSTKKLSLIDAEEIKIPSEIKTLAISCNNLIELHLSCYDGIGNINCFDVLDELLSEVFLNNRQLKSLYLGCFDDLTGECFLSLNKSIFEELCLNLTNNIEPEHLFKSFPYFEKFKEFHLSDYEGDDFYNIAGCLGLCSSLKIIKICDVQGCSDVSLIKSVSCSKNLENLQFSYLHEEVISDKLINFVSYNLPELKILDLYSVKNIFDYHMKLISRLPKLEELNIAYNKNLTGSGLENLVNIRKLYCWNCINIKDEYMIKLLKCAGKIARLDVSGCKLITNNFINVAIEVTKNRSNNILLEISVKGTNVDIDEIKENSPLLHIYRF